MKKSGTMDVSLFTGWHLMDNFTSHPGICLCEPRTVVLCLPYNCVSEAIWSHGFPQVAILCSSVCWPQPSYKMKTFLMTPGLYPHSQPWPPLLPILCEVGCWTSVICDTMHNVSPAQWLPFPPSTYSIIYLIVAFKSLSFDFVCLLMKASLYHSHAFRNLYYWTIHTK